MPAIDLPALTDSPASSEVSGAWTPSGPVVCTPEAARLPDSARKGQGPLPSSGSQETPSRASQPGSIR